MKGIGPLAILVIVMLVFLIGETIFLELFITRTESIIRTSREFEIITGINTLEFVKNSLKQSLRFSFYQASYNISNNGGYDSLDVINSRDNIAYWRMFGDTSGFPTNYIQNLQRITLTYMNNYVSAFRTREFTIPFYNEITVACKLISPDVCNLDFIAINASSEGVLQNRAGAFYLITDSPKISGEIDSRIQRLFNIGKINYVDQDSIKNSINNAINSMSSDCIRKSIPSYCENTPPDCESYFDNTCPDSLKISIRSQLDLLDSVSDGVQTNVEVKGLEVGHTSIIGGTVDGESGTCGTILGNETRHYRIVNDAHCDYSYFAATRVLVSINDTANIYPVYDYQEKTTDMRNLKLQFYIISGSDYSDAVKGLISP